MNWAIYVTGRAAKQLRKLPLKYRQRISEAIDTMVSNPFVGDVAKLTGKEQVWRRRIGDYRISYELDIGRKLVYVFDVRRRTSSAY